MGNNSKGNKGYGYRSKTRDLFSKRFKTRGMPNQTRYLTNFKCGDVVNVIGDPAIHKSLPHKIYHGKTGVVWNVTRRAVGVIVNKKVGPRVIRKRINVRVEHVHRSKGQDELKARVAENVRRVQLKKPTLKRVPAGQPRPACIVKKRHAVTELRPEVWDPLKAFKV
eukprot:TRINITY_DN13920_c0_g1_i2.p2 TRINITY_DN13920_c0_g1~~TRINITY_DN13920_c0_g1_i2.p2  ORF type:complete len:166 (+),score=72.28 TRINITY_DN13920_c0_g1_i2:2-499(+)